MLDLFKKIINFLLGLAILVLFYFLSNLVVKYLNIPLPPSIFGLILFAFCLIQGIIKEEWIKPVCDFLINNMAMFLVPFLVGLIVYKSLLIKNWLVIFVVIFITTTLVLVAVGLFVEWGVKYLRLCKIKKIQRNNND